MIERKHWACNLKNNTCIGCGTVICPLCLQEPFDCKCEIKIITARYEIRISKKINHQNILNAI